MNLFSLKKTNTNSPGVSGFNLIVVFLCTFQVLVEHAGRWKTDEDPLPLLEVYTVAILSFAKAASCLSAECENVPLLLEKLAL